MGSHEDQPALHMTYNVQHRLDAFVNGECGPEALAQELAAFCGTTPDSTWDVLSLIDQYHRRGKLPVALFQTVKQDIERHALGIQCRNTIREISGIANSSARPVVTAVPHNSGVIQEQTPSAKEPRIVSRSQATVHPERLGVGPRRLFGSEPPNDEADAAVDVREHLRRRRRITLSQAVLSATVVFGVGASPALRDLPKHVDAGNVAPAVAAAPISQIAEPGIITLSADRYVVFPGKRSAEINVHRTSGTGGDVSFVWWAEASGAKPGKDYLSGKPKIAHMLEGVDSLQLSVSILANPLRKHTELFYVVIGKPEGGASLGAIRRASVFIMRPD
jgi:hypothetical protein